ncbi:hypothetical protein [Pedobacter terrae]|uniref:hypothetical protein n=1 Tax=Pedobacter terrae TaxID=405671 RepID=UPI002FF9DCFC
MKRLYDRTLSTATIHKLLIRNNRQYLKLRRNYRKRLDRYNRPIPGDRVQMDVCKIAGKLYQYTAIDFKVVELFTRRTATNTLRFL